MFTRPRKAWPMNCAKTASGATFGLWARGVDSDLFQSRTNAIMAWRRSLGFADEDTVVVFVGRLVLEKGLDVFVETVSQRRRRQSAHRRRRT